jgi:hypothetical protein
VPHNLIIVGSPRTNSLLCCWLLLFDSSLRFVLTCCCASTSLLYFEGLNTIQSTLYFHCFRCTINYCVEDGCWCTTYTLLRFWFWFMAFNATFNNISVISRRSVFVVVISIFKYPSSNCFDTALGHVLHGQDFFVTFYYKRKWWW